MRSYYNKLNDGKYFVTSYRLSRTKGTYAVTYVTDYTPEELDAIESKEDIINPNDVVFDEHKTYDMVFRKDNTMHTIEFNSVITLYLLQLTIYNPLGTGAHLNIFDDELVLASFELTRDDESLPPNTYIIPFIIDPDTPHPELEEKPARIVEDADGNKYVDVTGINTLAYNRFLYAKIYDENLTIEDKYRFIPFLFNRNRMDENYNIDPMKLHFQLSGMDDFGLAQLFIDTYPVRDKSQAPSGETEPEEEPDVNPEPETPSEPEDSNSENNTEPEDPNSENNSD
jgi:hypothetical protein